MLTTFRPIIDELRPQRRPARVLYAFGAFWLLSGLLHVALLAVDGFQWAGSVSWRKPITFGFSIGLLLTTAGWILDGLPDRPRLAGALAWVLGIASTIEVGLITTQAWRGEASHFNTLEPVNAAIFGLMGTMVGVMSLCLVAILVWAMVRRPTDRLISAAVIAGMALVTTGLGIGSWLIQLGDAFVERYGLVPEAVVSGASGEPKFSHAVAFHGIQVFIVAALALRHTAMAESARRRSLRVVIGSYSAMLVFASMQAIVGAAPTQLTVWGVGQLASAVTLLAALVGIGVGQIRRPLVQETTTALAAV